VLDLDRLGGFVFPFYVLFIGGVILALVHVTPRVANYAFTGLAEETSEPPGTSRVAVGLEAQERAPGWRPEVHVSEKPPEPDVSAADLAKAIDDAENHPLPPDAKSNELLAGPRVAGWSKRIDRKRPRTESPDQLVLRSLGHEM
jgi:hypothetical protein